MTPSNGCIRGLTVAMAAAALIFGLQGNAYAHCDTLDGPVVRDAEVALEAGVVTPVLKWVHAGDESEVKEAFAAALAAKGKKDQERARKRFYETLVRIHRAGEGAPFTGLKPAGEIDAVIAAGDRSLAAGSADQLVEGLTEAVKQGIRTRYEKVAEALLHKDESVEKGRAFVAAYVEYTHYLEGLHKAAVGPVGHGNAGQDHAGAENHDGH
ncbi:DUF6448 family protein [Geobacter sp. DSM 9736]|uniref:DUF6448 family protein n=1 Tax=Geobacter sp. DSM 9736 TaxID=1277350 RepID=UPI000B50234A|nr:DUF6448 family protein [Geobacter sp. DSM 9736]SNB45201.1 hypothetical protein SAMN06269301_0604 [Geobacter sp. DSM 9736]